MGSDIRFATTQFEWPISAGQFDITIPGLGWTPKAFKITVLGGAVNEAAAGDASFGVGYATATDQRACGTLSTTGLSTTESRRSQSSSVCARKVEAGGVLLSLQAVAPIADGWTLDALEVSSGVAQCIIEFYGGADLEVEVGTWTPTSAAGASTFSGVAFTPNYIEVISVGDNASSNSHGIISSGAAYDNDGTVEQAALLACTGRDAASTQQGSLLLTENSITGQALWSGITWERRITGFIANGWSYNGTGATSSDFTYYLAMNTGTTKMAVRVVDSPASASLDWDVPGIGFKPQGLKLYLTVFEAAEVEVINFDARSGFFGRSACDNARSSSLACTLEDAASTTNNSTVSALKSAHMLNTDDSVLYDVGQPVFNSDGWSVPADDINNVASTVRKWFVVAIEAPAGKDSSRLCRPVIRSITRPVVRPVDGGVEHFSEV